MPTRDTFLAALRGCRALERLSDEAVDRLWEQASAEYGPPLKRAALRALLLAEGRGWLRPDKFTHGSEPPMCPLADAVAKAGTRSTSPPRGAAQEGVLSVPSPVLAHTLSFLTCYRVQHEAAATCRAFAAASRSPLAYSEIYTTASFLAVMARRGWWLYPPRRPQRVVVFSVHPHASGVLQHVSPLVTDVRMDAAMLSFLPPQTALTALHCWNADQDDVVRVVARPQSLRAVVMRGMRLISQADGRWWSSASGLRDLRVQQCRSEDEGLSRFTGFPALRSLVLADGIVTIGAVAAMLNAAQIVPQLSVHCTLAATSLPPSLLCVFGTVGFTSDQTSDASVALMRLIPGARHVTFSCPRAPHSPSLATVFRVCAGRVSRSLTVLLNTNVHAVGRPLTEDEAAVLHDRRLSVVNVYVKVEYRWAVENVSWFHHCLRVGRNVELRMAGPSVPGGELLALLKRYAPLFVWREVAMKDASTRFTGIYIARG